MSFTKGRRITYFDIETPNRRNSSISSIGLYAVDENGNVEEIYYLINPEDQFEEFNIKLTGITPNMVKDAMKFNEVWNQIEPYFTNSIVVAHNASFDLNVINKCLNRYNINKPIFNYICTYNLCKKLSFTKYLKLNELCSYFNIDLIHHHSANYDAKACMEIFNHIDKLYKLEESIVKQYIPNNVIKINKEEHKLLNSFINPNIENQCVIHFNNNNFCLTGNFSCGTKDDVKEMIIEKGGLILKDVSKNVHYVVIGNQGSESYKYGNYGSKVNKALILQDQGNPIKIISEDHLIEMLDCYEYSIDNLKDKIYLKLKLLIEESKCEEDELETIELKDNIKIKGYSYKAYKNVWFRLTTNMKDIYRLEINNFGLKEITKYKTIKTNDNFIRIDINKSEDDLLILLDNLKEYLIYSYLYICEHETVDQYACCSRYLECSNMKKCINKDLKDAKGCAYRRNLLAGRIFYGINRNTYNVVRNK